MRACLTSVLFLATIVASFATPVRPVDGKALMFRSLRNAHHETQIREKRQIPDDACVNAIQEAQSPLFMQCSNFLGDANALSFNQLLSFCGTDNCVPLLIKVFTDLESCGDDGNSTAELLEYLDLFCTQNSNGDYCLELVDEFDNGQLQLPYDDMDQCDSSQAVCSNACKNVADWVDTKLGCCYLTAVNAGQVPGDYILPEGFFTKCGKQQMTAC